MNKLEDCWVRDSNTDLGSSLQLSGAKGADRLSLRHQMQHGFISLVLNQDPNRKMCCVSRQEPKVSLDSKNMYKYK